MAQYKPGTTLTENVTIPSELGGLVEAVAAHVHDTWAAQRIKDGWSYGQKRDDILKKTPCLVTYDDLPDSEKEYDRITATETLKYIIKLGYTITKNSSEENSSTETKISHKYQSSNKGKYQIYIIYRNDGDECLTRLLEHKLTDCGFNVFCGADTLCLTTLNNSLLEKIDECTDVLVVLSPHSLDRCVEPNDWVRLEIAHALKQQKNIVPIFMRNFTFPDTLPEDIEQIRYLAGITANNEYFSAAFEKLVSKFLVSNTFNGKNH